MRPKEAVLINDKNFGINRTSNKLYEYHYKHIKEFRKDTGQN
jgi:hypothetical protein